MVAVMGDVFASVYNFHMPISLKVKLSVQKDKKLSLEKNSHGIRVLQLIVGKPASLSCPDC
jgi:hypothetical protein